MSRTAAPPSRGGLWLRAWRDWRSWPGTVTSVWRRSLRFRAVAITIALSALTILVACVLLALLVRNELFDSRLQQVLNDSRRATESAQTTLDASDTQSSAVQIQNLMQSVSASLAQQSSTDKIAVFRINRSPSQLAPLDFHSGALTEDMLTPQLRKRIQSSTGGGAQWWQSIGIPTAGGGRDAGIVVGQQLEVPDVGAYELYLAYDLNDASQTLGFVELILWLIGIPLVLLIGVIAWFVLRSVTTPISQAAETSAKLAAGDLAVRLAVHGQDELAILGRSFNAMADSIESQIKELADLSLVQQRFVSDVSHELRTPLTTIRLAADMLNDRRESFDAATARAAELLHAQVQRFETLLGDLLEISRYDAGSVELELEPTSLAHLAGDVIESMRQLAEQHDTDVRLVAPGGYSPIDIDPRRIRRIVRNLLGNAIEHGEGRPIVVTVDSDQQAAALGVRDFGLGMTASDAERVFDRFWRADPSRKRTIGGTGLGLSIALGDARLHGGTLAVWSELGRGTNFVLTLPRQRQAGDVPSPLATDPGEDGIGALELTQPIRIPTAPDAGGRP